MQSLFYTLMDVGQGKPVRNQFRERQFSSKDQARGFVLQINIR